MMNPRLRNANKLLLALSLLIALLAACGKREAASKVVKLPSGRTVRVLTVGRMDFAQGSPALVLKYQTDLPMTDVGALQAEADDIWTTFQPEVERAHLSNALISASSRPSGSFVSSTSSYNFVFQKDADGAWHRLANR